VGAGKAADVISDGSGCCALRTRTWQSMTAQSPESGTAIRRTIRVHKVFPAETTYICAAQARITLVKRREPKSKAVAERRMGDRTDS